MSCFFFQGFYTGGGDDVRRPRQLWKREGREGEGVVAERREGVRRQGGGRAPLPLQCLQLSQRIYTFNRVSDLGNGYIQRLQLADGYVQRLQLASGYFYRLQLANVYIRGLQLRQRIDNGCIQRLQLTNGYIRDE